MRLIVAVWCSQYGGTYSTSPGFVTTSRAPAARRARRSHSKTGTRGDWRARSCPLGKEYACFHAVGGSSHHRFAPDTCTKRLWYVSWWSEETVPAVASRKYLRSAPPASAPISAASGDASARSAASASKPIQRA